jgi:epoxyqueuosine reductase
VRIEQRVKAEAARLGFALCGIAPATEADGFGRFCDWLDAGYAGEMGYLHSHREQRRHPSSVVENVRSVIMVGLEYGGVTGPVARYAQGPDYHRYVWDRENELSAWLDAQVSGAYTHGVCDTAPILERDFARRAGLGWVGKNTMLIHKRRGSFILLGAVLTTAELAPDAPHTASHCGTCTACLDACPTQAFVSPGVLDARKCVSYLTIELAGSIPDGLKSGVGGHLFGCDVCQEVCPWVRHAGPPTGGLPTREDLQTLDAREVLQLSPAEFRRRFKPTAVWRAGRNGLRRNACVVLGNAGDRSALPLLAAATDDPDAGVRDAARWAVGRLTAAARPA